MYGWAERVQFLNNRSEVAGSTFSENHACSRWIDQSKFVAAASRYWRHLEPNYGSG
jgi:hypothetical protein